MCSEATTSEGAGGASLRTVTPFLPVGRATCERFGVNSEEACEQFGVNIEDP